MSTMLTKSFSKAELDCPCCGQAPMDKGFLVKLQELRDKWTKPIKINSGYRCPTHNTKVGGAATSRHMSGDACDIDISSMNGLEKREFLELILSMDWTGVGLHKSFYHVDTRPGRKVLWFYP